MLINLKRTALTILLTQILSLSTAVFAGSEIQFIPTNERHQVRNDTLQALRLVQKGSKDVGPEINKFAISLYENDMNRNEFKPYRMMLDHAYHGVYSRNRQDFQNDIIRNYLDGKPSDLENPTVIFTAGTVGVGKGFTLNKLKNLGLYSDSDYVTIDYDDIKKQFPEFSSLSKSSSLNLRKQAGDVTHAESAMVGELMQLFATNHRYNLVIDGTLKDASWFEPIFRNFRSLGYTVKLVYVRSTDIDTVIGNAAHRFKVEGRSVTREAIMNADAAVKVAVQSLAPLADLFVEIIGGSIDDQTSPYVHSYRAYQNGELMEEIEFSDFELLVADEGIIIQNGQKIFNHSLELAGEFVKSWGERHASH